MEQIKYNGVLYNVYINKENPDSNHKYETIVNAETGIMIDNEMEMCRNFLVANNDSIDKKKEYSL